MRPAVIYRSDFRAVYRKIEQRMSERDNNVKADEWKEEVWKMSDK